VGERLPAMAPASLVAKIQSGYVDFWWKGDTRLMKSLLDQLPAGITQMALSLRADGSRDAGARLFRGQKRPANFVGERGFLLQPADRPRKSSWKAATYLAQGDNVSAQKAFEVARPVFEAFVKEAPKTPIDMPILDGSMRLWDEETTRFTRDNAQLSSSPSRKTRSTVRS